MSATEICYVLAIIIPNQCTHELVYTLQQAQYDRPHGPLTTLTGCGVQVKAQGDHAHVFWARGAGRLDLVHIVGAVDVTTRQLDTYRAHTRSNIARVQRKRANLH